MRARRRYVIRRGWGTARGDDHPRTVWGEQKARELLGEAGFGNVTVHQLPGDIANNYYVTRRA